MERSGELELRRYLKSQRELAGRLIEGASLDGVAADFLSTVGELLRWEAGALWEVPEGFGPLRFVEGWSAAGVEAEALWERSREASFERGSGLPGRAWRSGEIAWIPHLSEDSGYLRAETAASLGLDTALAIPVPVGPSREVLAVAEFHARTFSRQSEELIDLLANFADQLALFIARRRAEARIEAGEDFKASMLGAAMDSIVGMDARGLILEFNEAAEVLFGYRREEVLGLELAEVLIPPDYRERHRAGLRRYLETGEAGIIDTRVELPAMRRDGSLVSVELTVTRVKGSDPPVFTGFLRDISDRADAERIRQHLAEVVRGTHDAVLSKDLDAVVTSWNPAAERLYGYTAEEAIGRHISFLVPADHKNEEQVILDRVVNGERLETYETERIRADGARIAVSLTVSQIRSPLRGVIGASVIARDITAEKRRRRAQDFLVAASRRLEASLDPEETARTIVRTAVPELAEFCLIDFVRPDGKLGESVVAGTDPAGARRLEEIRRHHPLDPDGNHPVAQVLREGRPMIWRDLTEPDVVRQVAQSDEHRRFMQETRYNSAAVVGLVARGRILGALTFLHADRDLRYDPADLDFLAELGDRAAMALDNARLYSERDQIAKSLQRGLRPPSPPEVPGLDISVVFEAAGEGIEIGGDLYDVIPTDDGCWVLVGDVAGKGSSAAGVSVALRHAVRGLVRDLDEPDAVLARVNELLLEGESLNDFATAMLLRMRRGERSWGVSLAGAGHPPAVHATRGGRSLLGGGTVLGAWSDSSIARHDLEVAAEQTLVLCTDGWLEAGPLDAHHDPEALGDMVQSLAELELADLTDRLRLDAVDRGSGVLRDDLVVLAVRPRAATREPAADRGAAAVGG